MRTIPTARWRGSPLGWGGARGQESEASITTQGQDCGARAQGSPAPQPGPRSTPRLFLQFGRTEVIDNTLNPDFVRKFIVDYFFEEKQNLRFDL